MINKAETKNNSALNAPTVKINILSSALRRTTFKSAVIHNKIVTLLSINLSYIMLKFIIVYKRHYINRIINYYQLF